MGDAVANEIVRCIEEAFKNNETHVISGLRLALNILAKEVYVYY